MTPVPSPRLIRWAVGLAAASLAVLAWPAVTLPLLAADLLLLGAALLDLFVSPRPRQVQVQRVAPDPLAVLKVASVAVRLRNTSWASVSVRLRDTIPGAFETSTTELTAEVPANSEQRVEYTIRPRSRGLYIWGPLHLRVRTLLGLWERRRVIPADAQSRVYPDLSLLHRYHILAQTHHLPALGIRQIRQRGSSWEFESLRDYSTGDDVRLLDWKATARRQKLIVRNQRAERNQTLLFLLDTGRLMNAEVEGAAKLDHAISAALVLAHIALSRGDRVGLCTFSHRVHSWVSPRGHLSQARSLSEALYDVKGDFTESDHGRCLRQVGVRHPKRAMLLVLTDFVDAQTSADMVSHLRLSARRHLVLLAALKDPFLVRAAHGYPDTPLEGFRKSAALGLLRERREVLEELRQAGLLVIDADPLAITAPLINQYLEATTRGLL